MYVTKFCQCLSQIRCHAKIPANNNDCGDLREWFALAQISCDIKFQTDFDTTLKVDITICRLFLIYVNSLFNSFSADDIKLNSVVFHWPDHIQKIFDLARNRIDHRKDLAMTELKKKYVIIFFNQFTQ